MVTAKAQYNLKNAEQYFGEHLSVGDYYDERQKTCGEWIGQGARMLGLNSRVAAEDFVALCENKDPQTGERLTARLKCLRSDGVNVTTNAAYFTTSRSHRRNRFQSSRWWHKTDELLKRTIGR